MKSFSLITAATVIKKQKQKETEDNELGEVQKGAAVALWACGLTKIYTYQFQYF
jgi:hypothetical protein